jgi:hypothetical protein
MRGPLGAHTGLCFGFVRERRPNFRVAVRDESLLQPLGGSEAPAALIPPDYPEGCELAEYEAKGAAR